MPAFFESGFSVRQPMWHGLGNILDEYPESWDDARLAAGLMWEPTEVPVYTKTVVTAGTPWPEGATAVGYDAATQPTPGDVLQADVLAFVASDFKGVARDDTNDLLGVVSDSWAAVTHGQMGEMLEALLGEDGKVKFETAGVLRGGRSVWALCYLDEPYTVPGDESQTYPYIALLNHHDGTGAAKIIPTQVRVVCWNTFSMASAEGERTGRQVVIRHSGNVAERIEAAKASLAELRTDARRYLELADVLAGVRVDDALVSTFLDRFIPAPENASDRVLANRQERQGEFMAIYNESPTTDGVRGTAYGLLMTATEYLDHMRPFRSSDTYLARTMLRPEPIKANVLSLVRELANVN